MTFSDVDILKRGPNIITEFDKSRVQPNSYDVALSPKLLIPIPNRVVDLRKKDISSFVTEKNMSDSPRKEHLLYPGKAILGSTVEFVNCPLDISMRIEGKSTLGRVFTVPHVAASGITPGFKGQITLEIVNLGPWIVTLYPGMLIAQLFFEPLTSPVSKPYGSEGLDSRYQNQKGPTVSS
jgi:dCTP deaminase